VVVARRASLYAGHCAMMESPKSPAGKPMTNEPLTYALIEKKIDQYVKDVADDKPNIVERLAFGTTMASWMPLLIAGQFAKSQQQYSSSQHVRCSC
jgi:hypothetical protein